MQMEAAANNVLQWLEVKSCRERVEQGVVQARHSEWYY